MQFMSWSEHFVTGYAEVDAQHRVLVDLVNEVAPLLADGGDADAAALDPVLDRLFAYAATHFTAEEALMRAGGLDPGQVEAHRHQHAAFVEEVVLMRMDLAQGGALQGAAMLRFLSSWLTFHILGEDQAMARQLRLIEGGLTAARALASVRAQEPADPAHAVLHGALLELFALNAARNKALAATNVELAAARDALARLNASLADEVRARTADLEHANATLMQANLDLRRAQATLVQVEKHRAMGHLAAGVAHEINTPLQVVSGNVHFMKKALGHAGLALHAWQRAAEGASDADRRQARDAATAELARLKVDYYLREAPVAVDQSLDALHRVSAIVGALQELAPERADAKGPVKLGDCIASAVTLSRGAWSAVAELETSLDPTVPEIPGYRAELGQVVLNLIANAADAIAVTAELGRKGRIRIATRCDGDAVELRVSDDGAGIPEAIQARIFEPFFTTKRVGEGTGQGLAFVHAAVVAKHGGTVTFETTLGVGTTFVVRLPVK